MMSQSISELERLSSQDLTAYLKSLIREQREIIKQEHRSGTKGRVISQKLSGLMDRVLEILYHVACKRHPELESMAIVANGGYGRNALFQGSDLDLLFLTRESSQRLSNEVKEGLNLILYPLWDLNLKVGHAVRNIAENIREGKADPLSRTTLLDSRYIVGNKPLFEEFKVKYRKDAIDNDKENFFNERSKDMEQRYRRYSSTVFLQEPNVKESPGGLRDWHNLQWLSETAIEGRSINFIQQEGIMNQSMAGQVSDSIDFLVRLRHEMHFITGKATNVLSLGLQGQIAESFSYSGPSILEKIEGLMRDYYKHAKSLHDRVMEVFEYLKIEMSSFQKRSLTTWLPWVKAEREKVKKFDGFFSKDGLLYARGEDVFEKDRTRLLRAFWHCQNYGLLLSPALKMIMTENLHIVDKGFRYSVTNRETLKTIFGMRGRVGPVLREMHRMGLLGALFPEFGALDCLVQHEFFHRFSADEHTLRCIDWLDRVATEEGEEYQLYGELFRKMEDPLILYMALLLHDTGRALNTDDHVDGSNALTLDFCRRVDITGEHKQLLCFLVEHHLTFFNVATKQDTDDPEVVAEFCKQMKTLDRLEALLVFTYCDSQGTNPDGWSGFKELSITTLYRRAKHAMELSNGETGPYIANIIEDQKMAVLAELDEKFHETVDGHFREMPVAYFRYREWDTIAVHVRAIWQYENRKKRRPNTPFEAAVQWTEYEKLGHSEVCIVAVDKLNLLPSICCAMASKKINILSANVHTRSDGIALDLFRVCTDEQEAVVDDILQMEVVAMIYKLNKKSTYNPQKYLKQTTSYFDKPVEIERAPVVSLTNQEGSGYTLVEVQATDRIGLLHDLLNLFAQNSLVTVGARIMTERNTAIDTFQITEEDGSKLSDERMQNLYPRLQEAAQGH